MTDYKDNLKDISKLPGKQLKKYVRKKAVSITKEKLIKSGKDVKDMSWEEIQELVAAEEKTVMSEMKSKGLIATAGLLALSLLNPITLAKSLIFEGDDDFDDEEFDDNFDLADDETEEAAVAENDQSEDGENV